MPKYLSLRPETSLWVSPDGCEVLRGDSLLMAGDQDMARFLSSCDGETDIEEIVARHTDSPEHARDALARMPRLVEALVRKQVLRVSDGPEPTPIRKVIRADFSPSAIQLELTDRCNLKCVYCYQESSPTRSNFMEDPVGILAYLKTIHVRVIELTGGEPLMHPQFLPALRYACENFQIVGLITNGTLLTDDIMEILKKGPARPSVQICLDGPDRETVDATAAVPGAWEQILRGIRCVKRHGVLLRVGMVLDSEAKIEGIEETARIAKELGADMFVASPAMNFGRARGPYLFDSPFMEKFLPVHSRLKERYGDWYNRESESIDPRNYSGCGAGHREVTVNWTGSVKICAMQPSDWLSFGPILEMTSPGSQERLRTFSDLKAPTQKSCGACPHLSYCMNCFVRAFSLLQSGAVERDRCEWYRQNADALLALETR